MVLRLLDQGSPRRDSECPQIFNSGAVAGVVEIEVGVVSGVFNLESPSVEAPGRRPRHEKCCHGT